MSTGLEGGQGLSGLWIPVRSCGCDQALSLAWSRRAKETSKAAGNSGWVGPPGGESRLVGSVRNGDGTNKPTPLGRTPRDPIAKSFIMSHQFMGQGFGARLHRQSFGCEVQLSGVLVEGTGQMGPSYAGT